MADTEKAIDDIYKKIEREKTLITAATHMRQSTSNAAVQARVDSTIRDGRRNITYLEDKLQELQLRQRGTYDDSAPTPPVHGGGGGGGYQTPDGRGQRGYQAGNAPTPPPKDSRGLFTGERGDYGDPGPGGYSQGNTGMMPPRAPYGDPRPYSAPMPKPRPNFSKLGMPRSRRCTL